jgi:hypothetical protein
MLGAGPEGEDARIGGAGSDAEKELEGEDDDAKVLNLHRPHAGG